jgi:YebC/PmpR family DNA-binding regulatory protein
MVDCMSNNRNRTVAEVRHAFSKCGGNMGAGGSVSFLFKKQGVLSYPPGSSEDAIMAAALEAGAEDVVVNGDTSIDVLTSAEDFGAVKDAMIGAKLVPENSEVTMHAATTIALDREDAEQILRLLEMLEDLDDVQSVYSNADISEDVLADLA